MSLRTVHMRPCARAGCPVRFDDFGQQPWPKAYCSAECHRLARPPKPAERRVSMPRTAGTSKRKPIAVASREQAAKRNAGVSIVSGASEGLDAAHLTPRPLGGCDDPLCVVPLTRAEHRAFDAGELDILGALVPHYTAEIAHALEHYRGDLPALLERLTGAKWRPVERAAA